MKYTKNYCLDFIGGRSRPDTSSKIAIYKGDHQGCSKLFSCIIKTIKNERLFFILVYQNRKTDLRAPDRDFQTLWDAILIQLCWSP